MAKHVIVTRDTKLLMSKRCYPMPHVRLNPNIMFVKLRDRTSEEPHDWKFKSPTDVVTFVLNDDVVIDDSGPIVVTNEDTGVWQHSDDDAAESE
jgi:hypothetical protein